MESHVTFSVLYQENFFYCATRKEIIIKTRNLQQAYVNTYL
jgi:hypothetical protein